MYEFPKVKIGCKKSGVGLLVEINGKPIEVRAIRFEGAVDEFATVQLTFVADVEIEGGFPVVSVGRESNTDVVDVRRDIGQLGSFVRGDLGELQRKIDSLLKEVSDLATQTTEARRRELIQARGIGRVGNW